MDLRKENQELARRLSSIIVDIRASPIEKNKLFEQLVNCLDEKSEEEKNKNINNLINWIFKMELITVEQKKWIDSPTQKLSN